MELLRENKETIILLEGFVLQQIVHKIGSSYFAIMLFDMFPHIPWITIAMVSSSAISPIVAIVYIALRLKFIPKITINPKKILLPLVSGIILTWLIIFLGVIMFGKESSFAQQIFYIPHPYYYPTLFLFVIWGPFIEETLYRCYFFEILRNKWGTTIALLLSSLLFAVSHALWIGNYPFFIYLFYLLYMFLVSVALTLVYMEGKLITSTLVHSFANIYFLILNN